MTASFAAPKAAPRPLPPGRTGLPLLGETLPFLEDGFGFVARRTAEHGPIFRTHVLGRPTAVLVGPAATARFIDPEIERGGSMPAHIQELFGGLSLPLLDGAQHLSRKTFILQAFTRDALASYLPEIERQVAAALDRWSREGEIVWVPELKRLAIEVICSTVMGIPAGPATEALRADYAHVLHAFSHLPIPLPGTAYSRGRAALARILSRFDAVIRERQAEPRDDGLSRILAATDAAGARIGLEECKTELHHLIIAGLVVFAELAAMIVELTKHMDIQATLRTDLDALPAGRALTLEALAAMSGLLAVVMEVKRLCPIVPVVFGKARESFEFNGHTVPAGWMVLWAPRSTLLDPGTWSDPERFDPGRYAGGRAEHQRHPHAFVPHGPGPAHGHRCPGMDFATLFMQVFAIRLLRGASWELLPGQDLAYDWSLIPPEPKSGLRARLHRR